MNRSGWKHTCSHFLVPHSRHKKFDGYIEIPTVLETLLLLLPGLLKYMLIHHRLLRLRAGRLTIIACNLKMSSEAKKPRLEEEIAITTFRRYLRINTCQPNPDYGNTVPFKSAITLMVICVASAVVFLQEVAKDVGLDCEVVEVSYKRGDLTYDWKNLALSW